MSDMVSMANPLWVSLANNQTPRSTQQSVAPALAQPTSEAKSESTSTASLKASVDTLGEMDTLIKLTNVIFQELLMLYYGYDQLSLAGRVQRLQKTYASFELMEGNIKNGGHPPQVTHMLLSRITYAKNTVVTFGAATLPGGLTPQEMKALLSPRDEQGKKDAHYDTAREKLNRAAKEELIKRLPEQLALTQGNQNALHGKQPHTAQRTLAELNGLMMLASKTGETLGDSVPNVESGLLAKN
jgi:hypothetical protein